MPRVRSICESPRSTDASPQSLAERQGRRQLARGPEWRRRGCSRSRRGLCRRSLDKPGSTPFLIATSRCGCASLLRYIRPRRWPVCWPNSLYDSCIDAGERGPSTPSRIMACPYGPGGAHGTRLDVAFLFAPGHASSSESQPSQLAGMPFLWRLRRDGRLSAVEMAVGTRSGATLRPAPLLLRSHLASCLRRDAANVARRGGYPPAVPKAGWARWSVTHLEPGIRRRRTWHANMQSAAGSYMVTPAGHTCRSPLSLFSVPQRA
jgi:hypothetical protein